MKYLLYSVEIGKFVGDGGLTEDMSEATRFDRIGDAMKVAAEAAEVAAFKVFGVEENESV